MALDAPPTMRPVGRSSRHVRWSPDLWRWIVAATVSLGLLVILGYQLRGPPPYIDGTTLALLAMIIVVLLIPIASGIGLPGGLSVAFTATEAEKTVAAVRTAAGGSPRLADPTRKTPKARELSERVAQLPSSKRAVLGWIVVEIQETLDRPRKVQPPRRLVAGARALISGCNRAIHSTDVELAAAERLAESAEGILQSLESGEPSLQDTGGQ